jgi:hypothetical protein
VSIKTYPEERKNSKTIPPYSNLFLNDISKSRVAYIKEGGLEIKDLKTNETKRLTKGYMDSAPSWSPSLDKIVFIRIIRYSSMPEFWKTSICIINSDGSGFKILTEGNYLDYAPTWTRDGTNKIVFTRYYKKYEKASIFFTTINASPGDEVLISDKLNSEIAYSCLKDGRILIGSTRDFPKGKYYLFTPNPGSTGKYENLNIDVELKGYVKNISISPDETKILGQYNEGWSYFNFRFFGFYLADIDIKTLKISNIKKIYDSATYIYNPVWTNKADYVLFFEYNQFNDKNSILLFSYSDGFYSKLHYDDSNYEYPCFESIPR